MDKPEIGIIGGGPGGLFCAYLLTQKVPGAKITLFQSSNRLGGKIITDEFSDGSPFEAGVAELYEGEALRQLIEKDLDLKTANMRGGGVVLHGKVLRSLKQLGKKFGPDTQKCVEKFYEKCTASTDDHPWKDKTFRQCIREECKNHTDDPDCAIDYIETAVASDLGTESHKCSGVHGIKSVLKRNGVYHVVGGLQQIPEKLVKKLGYAVTFRTGTRVTHIGKKVISEKDKEDGVTDDDGFTHYPNLLDESQYFVTTNKEGKRSEEYFDAVFVCLPNHWLSQIKWDGSKLKNSIPQLEGTPTHYLRVSMLFDAKWWRKYRLPGDYFMLDSLNGCCVYDESHRWGSSKTDKISCNVLSILVTGQDALLLCSGGQDDDEVVNYVIDALPKKWAAQAREHLVESQVDHFVGSGYIPTTDPIHQPEPHEHPNLYLVGGPTLNAALGSADTTTKLYAEGLGIDLGKDEETALSIREGQHAVGPGEASNLEEWNMVDEFGMHPPGIYYTGTHSGNLPTIGERGLVPPKLKGDPIGDDPGISERIRQHAHQSVYLTKSLPYANTYAHMAANDNNTEPALLRVTIPREHWKNIKRDEEPTTVFSRRWEGVIPPEWIEHVPHFAEDDE